MFVIRKATFAAVLIAALLSACAGGASEAPPTPLADAQFQRVFDAARSPEDVFQEDRNLTVILERTDLTRWSPLDVVSS